MLATRIGFFRALWTMGLVQLLSSLGYAAAAAVPADIAVISAAALFENFAAGLGTAAFLAFLMSVCERRYAATQFALLTAAYALSRWAVGLVSGVLAERFGFASYFLLTFALGVPAYGLLPWIREARGGEGVTLSEAKGDHTEHGPLRFAQGDTLLLSHLATASCISRWRCQASSTGASLGSCSTSRGWPNSTIRSASDA